MKLFCYTNFIYLIVIGVCNVHASQLGLEKVSNDELRNLLKEENYVLALFMRSNDCMGECASKEKSLLSIREELAEALGTWVISVHDPDMLSSIGGDTNVDTIVFFRHQKPLLCINLFEDDDELLNYLLQNKESNVHSLTDATFEHETQASTGATTGDWLVIFTKEECDECEKIRAHVETTASNLRGRKNVAIIHRPDDSAVTTRRFGVTSFPFAIYFRLGKLYRYPIPAMTEATLTAFANDGFRNARAEDIPHPKTPFDDVTQAIADWIRENPWHFIGGVAGVFFMMLLLVLLNSPPPPSWTKSKKKKTK